MNIANYRAITIINIMARVFVTITHSRLKKLIEEGKVLGE